MEKVLSPERRRTEIFRFARLLALVLGLVCVFPAIVAFFGRPGGSTYLGYQYNLDDHMVYAAWMRQAMDGRFFFDNRFAVDPQPGLTVHLYFWVLGNLARLTGIGFAATLGRLAFSVLFVFLCARLVERLGANVFISKLALAFACLGGGAGFLVWQNYGIAMHPGSGVLLAGIAQGKLPVDVWQPEVFVFPSMLTNGLFMVSLCLIVAILLSVLDARENWHPVLGGAVAFGLLMNIHSYDVLLVALVLVGFLAASIVARQATWQWVARVAVMGLGAIPPALWFMHVLANDKVFQARAATETFAPNFRQIALGLLPGLLLMFLGLLLAQNLRPRQQAGFGLAMLGFVGLFGAASQHQAGYWMSPVVWGVVFSGAVLAVALLARDEPAYNLALSWAFVGLIALYFPALFQRKLAMGLAIPVGLLAAFGLAEVMRKLDRAPRNMVAVLAIVALSGSSLRWFFREFVYVGTNVSNTTLHPVFLSHDASRIVSYLNDRNGTRSVLVCLPGVQMPTESPDQFRTPYVPDLNPILSGLTGVYTYAGHWSETPDYGGRRNAVIREVFSPQATPEQRTKFLDEIQANYVVVPKKEAVPQLQIADLTGLGEVVVEGTQYDLVRLPR